MTSRQEGGRTTGAAPARKRGGKGTVRSVEELMSIAFAMETEAAERYAEFADVMETHNNVEVAELFRKMARIEGLHAQQIRDRMGWHEGPPQGVSYRWEGLEGPETADHTDLHYLMTPHHALQIARINEERAHRFWAEVAGGLADGSLRAAAEEMAEEEAEHVRLIDEWLARTASPDDDWSHDQDPPNYVE
jgi:rubrerythrin